MIAGFGLLEGFEREALVAFSPERPVGARDDCNDNRFMGPIEDASVLLGTVCGVICMPAFCCAFCLSFFLCFAFFLSPCP